MLLVASDVDNVQKPVRHWVGGASVVVSFAGVFPLSYSARNNHLIVVKGRENK